MYQLILDLMTILLFFDTQEKSLYDFYIIYQSYNFYAFWFCFIILQIVFRLFEPIIGDSDDYLVIGIFHAIIGIFCIFLIEKFKTVYIFVFCFWLADLFVLLGFHLYIIWILLVIYRFLRKLFFYVKNLLV